MLVLNLGRECYEEAWELQHRLVKARLEGRVDDVLVLLEHEPVITVGRMGDTSHILASEEQLEKAGIAVHRVERGGDVTYHGPGQLVGYPVLFLEAHGLGVSDYMHALEELLIRTLLDFGLVAHRRPGVIGVWIGQGKVAALGARVQRGVTYHGFALNVAPNLGHFSLIVPCGLFGAQVTSMERELGRPPQMSCVRQRVMHNFAQVLTLELEETTLQQLQV